MSQLEKYKLNFNVTKKPSLPQLSPTVRILKSIVNPNAAHLPTALMDFSNDLVKAGSPDELSTLLVSGIKEGFNSLRLLNKNQRLGPSVKESKINEVSDGIRLLLRFSVAQADKWGIPLPQWEVRRALTVLLSDSHSEANVNIAKEFMPRLKPADAFVAFDKSRVAAIASSISKTPAILALINSDEGPKKVSSARAFTEALRDIFAKHYEISGPRIVNSDPGGPGFCISMDENIIYIGFRRLLNNGITWEKLAEATLHELRHSYQGTQIKLFNEYLKEKGMKALIRGTGEDFSHAELMAISAVIYETPQEIRSKIFLTEDLIGVSPDHGDPYNNQYIENDAGNFERAILAAIKSQ